MTMTEGELLNLVGQAEQDAVAFNGEYKHLNETFLSTYLGNLYGDEEEDSSQVVSMDVQDTIESDMPSCMRVFGTDEAVMMYKPNSKAPQAKQEAIEKTSYINWIINHQENTFKIKSDWVKSALIQKVGVVRYDYEEKETVEEQEYSGLSEEEMLLLVNDLNQEVEREGAKLDIKERSIENGEHSIKFKIKRTEKNFVIKNIPVESFLISRNATSKDDAELVGDTTMMSRSDLIAMGFDVEVVKGLPADQEPQGGTAGSSRYRKTAAGTIKSIRFQDQGGDAGGNEINHWASQKVRVSNLYVKVDYDDDGIAERRHIIKAGNTILHNEVFEIAPYAIMSAISMPHNAIGRSRAELVQQTQRVKTVLFRQILNNIYRVNNARTVVNDEVTNIDDLLVARPNGIVRTNGDPMTAVAQLETPYIGDQALQVVQYIDSQRAQTTGAYLANQGLDSDQLYQETATRFLGVQEQGEAKIELVVRNMVETGWRDLYNGLCWLVQRYQNTPTEIMVLGKELTVDPRKWRLNQHLSSNIGLAAGDDENTIQNMTGLLQVDEQLRQSGSLLVDQKKTYNKLAKMLNAMGLSDLQDFYNDPEQPDQVLLAQNEQLTQMVELMQQQLQQAQNPLAEAEMIKQQSSMMQAQAKSELEVAKLAEQVRQFDLKYSEEQRQYNTDKVFDMTELEAQTGKDIPGSTI